MSVNLVQVYILETKLNGTLAPSTTGRTIGMSLGGSTPWIPPAWRGGATQVFSQLFGQLHYIETILDEIRNRRPCVADLWAHWLPMKETPSYT